MKKKKKLRKRKNARDKVKFRERINESKQKEGKEGKKERRGV
jgi:hypothetical protein